MSLTDTNVLERDSDNISNSGENVYGKLFKCCSKPCKVMVCKNCFNFYHEGCTKRMKNVNHQNESVLICCQEIRSIPEVNESNNMASNIFEQKIAALSMEISYLKEIIHQVEDKNKILAHNNFLLIEKMNNSNCKQREDKLKYETRVTSVIENPPRIINEGKDFIMTGVQKPAGKTMVPSISITDSKERIEFNEGNYASKVRTTVDDRLQMTIRKPALGNDINKVQTQTFKQKDETSLNIQSTGQENDSDVNIEHARNERIEKKLENFENDEDGNWRKVTYRKRNHMRPVPIKGAKENFNLTVAKKESCLFLSGLGPEIKPEEVKEYIDKILKIDTKCEKMRTRKDKYRSCFKLYVPYDMREDVMNSDMWGKGVTINFFLHLRRNLERGRDPMEK